MTVTGWQDPEQLGFCQPHEHLMISAGVSSQLNSTLLIDDIAKSTAEVFKFKAAGGGTIIDAQPGGANRCPEALLAISKETGVNIIASTGFHKHCFYPKDHWLFTGTLAGLTNIFVHELTIGMFCNIDHHFSPKFIASKAGIIKVALDGCTLTPIYQKCFQAAAYAAIECEVPMMVHIEQGSNPLALLKNLISLGVPAKRIIFCHMDRDVMPLSYYTKVLDLGATLEFDTIGRFKYHSDEDEVTLIMDLLKAGYENQLLFSLDTTSERLKSYNPKGIGLTYIIESFLPMLKEAGMTDSQIQKITHTNLINIFTHSTSTR